MLVGWIDFVGFMTLLVSGINLTPIVNLQYYSIGLQYVDDVDMIDECQKQVHKNSTCKDLEDKIQEGLADMNMYINLFKGLLSPFSLILMGSLSDMVGKKVPIILVIFMTMLWTIITLVNSFYITVFPTWMFIIQNGVLLGIMGGSNFSICTLSLAYVAMETPVKKRSSRFSILLGVNLLGFVGGPLISASMMAKNMYVEIGAISSGMAFIILIIAVVTLKKDVTNLEESYAEMCDNHTFSQKIILSIQLQVANFKDLFATSEHIAALLTSIAMFMLTTVGLICPLATITSVYSLGDPFNWSAKWRSYYVSGLLLLLAIQSSLTLKVLEMLKLSRTSIARFGIFMGFVGSFFLALASITYTLLIGVAITSFIIVASPTIQSMTASLVKESQIGCVFGLLGAVQSFAECGIINLILFIYSHTRKILNGFCFFAVSFLMAINLVLATFYQHPTVKREDSYTGTTITEPERTKLLSSSNVLAGGVPKTTSDVQPITADQAHTF